jgi:hypothetical protein
MVSLASFDGRYRREFPASSKEIRAGNGINLELAALMKPPKKN